MAGLPHLFDIATKKGNDFINSLFNQNLTVTEKLDGNRFEFQKQDNGDFLYYKRNPKVPISKIERTMMSFFEKPIEYIENLSESVIKKLPTDYRFGMEYFLNKKPVATLYDRIPKNHLVLTDIKVLDESGKTKKIITDVKELTKWAKLLNIEEPPVYFDGKLSNQQKQQLVDFVQTPFDDLVEKFKTESFVRFILSIINPKLKTTALNNDLDKPIEGIVFKFVKNDEEFLAKMVDPIFTKNAREKAKNRNKPTTDKADSTQQVIKDLTAFMKLKGFDNYDLKEDSVPDRYIELMSLVFLDFIKTNKISEYSFDVPEFAKQTAFKINPKFIKNKKVLSYTDSDMIYHNLFKTLLRIFEKPRKRPTKVIDKPMIIDINSVIKLIDEKTLKSINEQIINLLENKVFSGKILKFDDFINQ